MVWSITLAFLLTKFLFSSWFYAGKCEVKHGFHDRITVSNACWFSVWNIYLDNNKHYQRHHFSLAYNDEVEFTKEDSIDKIDH